MEDEDKNSKSLVLITRVGSTPTTGIKKSTQERKFLGAFLVLATLFNTLDILWCSPLKKYRCIKNRFLIFC